MSRTIKIFFTLSILVNLLLVGLIAGHITKKWRESDWYEVREKLQPESRDLLDQTRKANRSEKRALFREMRANVKKMTKILTADDFNAEEFEAAAAELKAAQLKLTEHRFNAMKEMALKLPQSERKIIVEKFSKKLMGRHHHKGKGKWKKGDDRWDGKGDRDPRSMERKMKMFREQRGLPPQPGQDVHNEDAQPEFIVPEQIEDGVLDEDPEETSDEAK